jgi:uncharacterized protein YqgV (UPF0045/DUF77 family)
MAITAQFSLYPLRTRQLAPALEAALSAARATGIAMETGLMSSVLEGSEEQVFAALRAAFSAAAQHGDAVLVVTVSNACKRDG